MANLVRFLNRIKLRQVPMQFKRQQTTNSNIILSEEISNALQTGLPTVALESTIITHGMPYPHNYNIAIELETIARSQGAIPATIGVIQGKIYVGLNKSQLKWLSDSTQRKHSKISRRDFPYVIAESLSGGTTVSGSMLIAHLCGIPIFATGGIGGVHRGGQSSLDISADLTEMGRTPITVVSAGVKSILDIGRTLEYLETLGVCVCVYGDTNDFPGFYVRKSGHNAPFAVRTPQQAANIIKKRDELSIQSAILFAVPIPEIYARNDIESAILEAVNRAERENVKGKDITPFILSLVAELTEGKSLEANKALIRNNVLVASQIAVLHKEVINKRPGDSQKSAKSKTQMELPVVIGGSNVDLVATTTDNITQLDNETHPGKVTLTLGGVARNIADCLGKLGQSHKFISCIGNDIYGNLLQDDAVSKADKDFVEILSNVPTAKCSLILNNQKECVILVGDFEAHKHITTQMILKHRDFISKAPLVVLDGNVPKDTFEKCIEICSEFNVPVWFEPTDINKAGMIFQSESWKKLTYASPNISELKVMTRTLAIKEGSKLPTLDCNDFSDKAITEYCLTISEPLMRHWHTLVVTLGPSGLLVLTKLKNGELLPRKNRYIHTTEEYKSRPVHAFKFSTLPSKSTIRSVSGAGDCLAGGMIASILKGDTFEKCVEAGLKAANLSLASDVTVPETITPTEIYCSLK